MTKSDRARVTYHGSTTDLTTSLGDSHPFAAWLADAEYEIHLHDDGEAVRVRDGRDDGIVTEVTANATRIRYLDTERELVATGPHGRPSLDDERGSLRRAGERAVTVGAEAVDVVDLTTVVGGFELRVAVAPDHPTTTALASAARRLFVPLELPVDGLPVEVQVRDDEGAQCRLELAELDRADVERYETDDWPRVDPGWLFDLDGFAVQRDPESADARFPDEPSPSGARPSSDVVTRTAGLEQPYRPDAGWVVDQEYFDEVRAGLNDVLAPFTEFGALLADGEIDWWTAVEHSLDRDDPALAIPKRVLTLLAVTNGAGLGLPEWVTRLATAVDVTAALEEGERGAFETNQSDLESGSRQSVEAALPDSLEALWIGFELGGGSTAFDNWFALAAAVNANSGSTDFDTRFGEIADDVWTAALGGGGHGEATIPFEPLTVELSEAERTATTTIAASDLVNDVSLPSWVDDLAKVEVTPLTASVSLPREKLSNLTVDVVFRDDDPDVPVIEATLSIDEVSTNFQYESRPAFSAGSLAAWIGTTGRVAAAVTANGAGYHTARGVDVPLRFVPTTEDRHLGYSVRVGDPSVDSTSVTLSNSNPASMLTTAVASAWLEAETAYFEDVIEEALGQSGVVGGTHDLPNAWPASFHLDESPPAEGFRAGDDVRIGLVSRTLARGIDLATDESDAITVARAGREGTTAYPLPDEPRVQFEPHEMGPGAGGLVFSRRYLVAWLLDRVGLPPERYDGSLDPLLDDLGVELRSISRLKAAGELETLADQLDEDNPAVQFEERIDPRGRRTAEDGFCLPPTGTSGTIERVKRIHRSAPTFDTPANGTSAHALDVQVTYGFTVKDVLEKTVWAKTVHPEQCIDARAAFGRDDVAARLDELVDERAADLLAQIRDREDLPEAVRDPGGSARTGPDSPGPRRRTPDEVDGPDAGAAGAGERASVRVRTMDVPGRDGPRGSLRVYCVPENCHWNPERERTTLERYLAAGVSVRARVRVGFSTFGPLEYATSPKSLLHFFIDPRVRNRLRGGGSGSERDGMAETVGWLPQVDLRVTAAGPSDLTTDPANDTFVRETAGPFADLATDELRETLLDFCREDFFDWLEPVANFGGTTPNAHDQFPVSHEGSLVSDTAGTLLLASIGYNALSSPDDADLAQLTGLAKLRGRTDDDAYPAPPTHVIDGDYVYLPVELEQGLSDLIS